MSGPNVARQLGQRMCAAWGIDPALCVGITVEWRPDAMPVAVVELMLTEGAVRELLTLDVIDRWPA